MRVDISKIRVGAGGWRGAGRIRAFKGLQFYFFFFFSKAIKMEKGHNKDSTTLNRSASPGSILCLNYYFN